MKLLLLLFALYCSSSQATEDAVDSPIISYMLAKLQNLDSKVNGLTSSSATRDVSKRDKDAQCNCPLGVVTYVRWGNATCPYGANTVYSGFTAGSWYDHYGAAVEPLCLPPDPQYLKSVKGYQNLARLYGAEYQTTGPLNHADNRNIPCALCQAYGRTNMIMIPSRYECPPGWNTEYYGYLMAGHAGHKAGTMYTCVDKSFEQIEGSGADTNGRLFYTVEAYCNHFIPCSDQELTCAVCTK